MSDPDEPFHQLERAAAPDGSDEGAGGGATGTRQSAAEAAIIAANGKLSAVRDLSFESRSLIVRASRSLWSSSTLALLAASPLPGCTEFEDGEDVAETSSLQPAGAAGGLGALPAEDAPEWACITGAPAAPPAALGDTSVTFTIFIADTVTRQPPPGLTVTACSPLDIECTAPMTAAVAPESDGFVRVRVPQNFAGFFQIQSAQTVPAMLYVDGTVAEDMTAPPMLLIGQGPFQALSQSQGVAIDPLMGHLLLQAFDCTGNPAPGMRFINDKGGQPFAFVDALPVVGQTVTDAQGTAGFLNVLPGLAIVQSVRVDAGSVIETETGRVRAGWFTYLVFGANG